MPKDYKAEDIPGEVHDEIQYIPQMEEATIRPDYINEGLDVSTLVVPASGPTTRSKGKLRLGNDYLPTDDTIETFPRSKKESYKKVKYKLKYIPPESEGVPARRSDRLRGVPPTTWKSSKDS